jgi:hypothetical protein
LQGFTSVGQDKAAFAYHTAGGFFFFFGNAAVLCRIRLLGTSNAVQQIEGGKHNDDCKEFHAVLFKNDVLFE